MKITTSSDWRDSLPFETPLRAALAVPGEPVRCAGCPSAAAPRQREELWVVKHRHPNNHAGFVRFYCETHRPVAKAPAPRERSSAARERSSSPRKPAAPRIPERVAALCPDCFVEVPASGVCGMCGNRVE